MAEVEKGRGQEGRVLQNSVMSSMHLPWYTCSGLPPKQYII
jgi:hypothetical protein